MNLVLLLSPIQNFAAFILLSDSQRYPDSFQEHFEEGTHPGPLAPDPEILCWTTPTSIYTDILRKNSWGGDITWNLVLLLSPIQNFAAFILLSDSQRYYRGRALLAFSALCAGVRCSNYRPLTINHSTRKRDYLLPRRFISLYHNHSIDSISYLLTIQSTTTDSIKTICVEPCNCISKSYFTRE